MPNRFIPISATDIVSLVRQLNLNFAKLDNEGVTKSFNGPGGTKALVQGRLPNDAGYGEILYDRNGKAVIYLAVSNDGKPILKVAKANKDAVTGSDSDLVFNSNQNTFKIINSDTITLNRPAGTASVSLDVPAPVAASAFLAWGTVTSASPNLTYTIPYYAPSGTGTMLWGIRAYYDSSVGVVRFFHESYDAGVTGTTYNVSIKYYLLQETLV